MAAEQALALVVRGTDWSETSRITTLFTREFGKVRGLAKGGRRLKSSFDGAFDLLTVCRVVFLRKAHGGLDLLTEARMEERFPALRENLSALYAGYYVAELLSDGTQDYDPHPDLFDAALDTLRKLGRSPEQPNPPGPPSLRGKGGDEPTDLSGGIAASAESQEVTPREHPSPSGGGAGGGVATSAPVRAGTRADAPNPPGPPSLRGKGGDEPTDWPGTSVAEAVPQEAAGINHPSHSGGGAGGGVATSAPGPGVRRADAPNPPGPPSLGGKGGDEPTDWQGDVAASAKSQEVTPREHPSPSGGGGGGGVDHVRASSTLRRPPAPQVADLVTRFELVWLKELGYSPRLDVCTGCGKAVPGGVPRVWFSAAAGGVVCTPCSPAQADRRPLSGDAVRALAALAAGGPVELESVRAELRALLGQVVSFVLGRRPRMHRFLADG